MSRKTVSHPIGGTFEIEFLWNRDGVELWAVVNTNPLQSMVRVAPDTWIPADATAPEYHEI